MRIVAAIAGRGRPSPPRSPRTPRSGCPKLRLARREPPPAKPRPGTVAPSTRDSSGNPILRVYEEQIDRQNRKAAGLSASAAADPIAAELGSRPGQPELTIGQTPVFREDM